MHAGPVAFILLTHKQRLLSRAASMRGRGYSTEQFHASFLMCECAGSLLFNHSCNFRMDYMVIFSTVLFNIFTFENKKIIVLDSSCFRSSCSAFVKTKWLLPTQTISVGVRRIFESVCLSAA